MILHESPTLTFCFAMDFHYSERIGGAEVQAWLLAKELARRGHEVHYLAQSLQGKANEMEVREGVRLQWLKYRGYFLWRNGLEYYRTLRRLAPDMIIQRMTSFNTGVIGLYARRHHKPFAWICTDNGIPERWSFTRKERHAARRNYDPAMSIIGFDDILAPAVLRAGIGKVVRSFDESLITVRRWLQDDQMREASSQRTHELAFKKFDIRRVVD